MSAPSPEEVANALSSITSLSRKQSKQLTALLYIGGLFLVAGAGGGVWVANNNNRASKIEIKLDNVVTTLKEQGQQSKEIENRMDLRLRTLEIQQGTYEAVQQQILNTVNRIEARSEQD